MLISLYPVDILRLYFCALHLNIILCEVHLITCHEGVGGEQRYSSTPSLTLVLDGDKCTLAHFGHLNPGKDPVPIVQEAGWASGLA
jgi:hypothetical protein